MVSAETNAALAYNTMTATGYQEVVVAEGVDGTPEFRKTVDSEPPSIRDVGDRGWGTDLQTPAWNDVRDRLDPDDFELGTHVATIHYDLDEWNYRIEYHARQGVLDRVRAVFGGGR